jgi:hypothetical protein
MDFYCGSCTSEPESSNYYAILDSGANYNFFTKNADVDEKDSNHSPIQVTMPNNAAAMSSHKCKVKVPLPEPANKGFVLPELNHSLLAVRLLVKAGCLPFTFQRQPWKTLPRCHAFVLPFPPYCGLA